MRVRITQLKNDKLVNLGDVLINNTLMIPSVGDSLYYKGVKQYKVIERHFNIMEASLYDVELFVE